MKKTLSALLALVLLVSTLTCTVSAAEPTTMMKPTRVTSDVRPIKGNPHGSPPSQGGGRPDKDGGPDLSQPNKWAVIIGIADYRGVGNDLWNPDDDAREMYTVLTTGYGFAADHIKVLIDKQAKANAIIDAIRWLRDWENESSTVAFFFCGHGYQAPDDWDDDIEDGIDECVVSYDMYGITDGYLAKEFSTFQSTNITLIFGQCFSGGMDDTSADDRVVVAACQETQYSHDVNSEWDEWGRKNTLFGYFFIEERLPFSSVETAFNEAHDDVTLWVDWYNAGHGETVGYIYQEPVMFDRYAGEFYL